MKLTLKVTPNDGDPYEVTTNLHTIVQMERKFKMRASDLATGIAMEHLAFMAFEAGKAAGIPTKAVFDDFIKSIENVEVVATEAGNPTEVAHSADL